MDDRLVMQQHRVRDILTWCFFCTLMVAFVTVSASSRQDSADVFSAELTKAEIRKTQYSQLAEALWRTLPWTPLSHGGFGQHDGISVLGGTNSDLAVSIGGRAMVDPWSGQFQLLQVAPEGIETATLRLGTESIGKSAALTLSSLDIVPRRFNSATPYLSLWYHQSGGELIATDITFAQNISQNVSFNVGVRRSGAPGRFAGTDFDIWNIRAGLRWELDSLSTAEFNWQTASVNSDLWGGVTSQGLASSISEELAPTVFVGLQSETRRNDVTATFTRQLSADSSSVLSISAYGSVNALRRTYDTTETIRGSLFGVLARLTQNLPFGKLHVGAGVDRLESDGWKYSRSVNTIAPQVFGHLSMPLSDLFLLRGAARVVIDQGNVRTGAGVGLDVNTGRHGVRFDLSTMQRTPTPSEHGTLKPEHHILSTLGTVLSAGLWKSNITAYYRRVNNPIVTTALRDGETILSSSYINANTRDMMGLVADLRGVVGHWEVFAIARVSQQFLDAKNDDRAPLLMADVSLAYMMLFGNSVVRMGVRSSVLSSARLPQFNPLDWSYVEPTNQTGGQFDGGSVFVSALLGNASVRASFENIFAQRWYTTSFAPEISQSIRLSVTWAFLE